MSKSYPAFLQFHHLNNCFGYVKNETLFSSNTKISWNSTSLGELLGSYNIRSCDDPNVTLVVQLYGKLPISHVFINAVLAVNAGFKEMQEVIIDAVEPTSCTGVDVAPLSIHDFEIMDKSRSSVESLFLNQLTIVKKGMIFPLWLSPSMHVLFKIVNVVPPTELPVYLVENSELYVLPSVANSPAPSTVTTRQLSQVDNVFNNIPLDITTNIVSFSSRQIKRKVIRFLPKVMFEKCKIIQQTSHPSVVYTIGKDEQYSSFDIVSTLRSNDVTGPAQFAVLIHCPENNESLEGVAKAVVSILKNRPDHCITTSPVYSCYTRISCSSVDMKRVHPLKQCQISFVRKSPDEEIPQIEFKVVERALQSISAIYPVLMGYQGIQLNLPNLDNNKTTILLEPSGLDSNKLKFDKASVCFAARNNTIFVLKEDEQVHDVKAEITETVPTNFGFSEMSPALNLECQTSIVRNIVCFIEKYYQFEDKKHFGHSLLLGREGCGKTYIANRVARRLAKSSSCLFSIYIDCYSWKGKQSDSIEKSLKMEMKRLEVRQPSLLILDNLDFFQVQGEEEHRQLAVERLFNMVQKILIESKVSVLATARTLHTLHKSLIIQGSKRLFANIIEIPALCQNDRINVLREFLEPDCNPTTAAKATDNFNLSDLRKLATRIQLECRIRGSSVISDEDIELALHHSKPISSFTEKQKAHKIVLNDVGGMEKQKQLLTEILIWPTKYSELYDSCGIKLGRGVLLHGQSGCGKTMLANAFAAYTDFNLISIKGPELLSKYIGSSEENVRNVFERARAQTPCIVIFDELDSLAPKRGHDSTGVTDRVVNQLLTELDGAEGLNGVFVIGCTSRIDMIDSALLRPGRFDHLIECSLPDVKERSAIIRVILKSVPHAVISHTALSYRTEKWSGADLRALITNAQFNSHRRATTGFDMDEIPITEEDIDAVFEDSRPKERRQQVASFKAGQTVTLA